MELIEAKPHLLFLCTGNAARSVMAAVITRSRSDLFEVSGAGTMTVEGCPMGNYTRKALASIGLEDRTHRSRQLYFDNAMEADVIVAMAREHVQYVRRVIPEAAAKTATLKRLVRELGEVGGSGGEGVDGEGTGDSSGVGDSGEGVGDGREAGAGGMGVSGLREALLRRIQQMQLEKVSLEPWEEIGDPGSGTHQIFATTLEEIDALVDEFLALFPTDKLRENLSPLSKQAVSADQ